MKFESFPKIEKKEQLPELKIKFVLGYHITKENAELVGPEIKKTDVFCPELMGWEPEHEKDLNRVSLGKLSPEEFIEKNPLEFPKFYQRMLEYLYDSRVIVKIIDLPAWQVRDGENFVGGFVKQTRNKFYKGDFDESVEYRKMAIEAEAILVRLREDYLTDELENLLPKILKINPELKKRKEISILVNLGLMHTRPYQTIKEKFPQKTKRILPSPPIFLGNYQKLLKKKILKPEAEFSKEDDEKVARVFVEEMILGWLFSKFGAGGGLDVAKISALANFLVSGLKYNDIKNFSQEIAKNNYHPEKDLDAILKLLEKNWRVKIPTNKEEIDKLSEKIIKKRKGAVAE